MLPLVLASLLWSLSFALIGASGIDPDLLAALRLGLAALAFAPLAILGGGPRRSGRERATLLAIGAVQFGLMYILVHRSYGYLESHEVALLTITTPLFVVALNGLKDRRGLGRATAGACVAVVAAALLRASREGIAGAAAPDYWIGVGLVQGANAAFAAGQVAYGRCFGKVATRALARGFAWTFLGAFAVAGAMALATVDRAALDLDRGQWATVLYLGLVPSGLAFFLWNLGATRVRVGTLAVMNNLKIPLAVLVALVPPFDGWRTLGSDGALRLAASAVVFAAALALVSAGPSAGPTAGEGAR